MVTGPYNTWGYISNTTGTMAETLGKSNALRYRGYVYDTETCLYYLQSRYYNPGTGRFINADALVITGQGLLGNNMFAYCLNNPIVYSIHFMQIGVIAYTATVMVPSMACFWGGVPYDIYYSLPWEYVAECLGNVKRENYSYLPSANTVAEIYWFYTQIVSGGE